DGRSARLFATRSGGAGRARARPRRRAQRCAAPGGDAPRRPAARGRRRGHGEDAHPRLPGRASGRARGAAGADPPADVHPPRRPGDDRARGAARRGAWPAGARRHLPRDRAPAAAAVRAARRARGRLHDHGPGRRPGSDAALARGARLRREAPQALSEEGDAPPRLLAPREHRPARGRDPARPVPAVRRVRARHGAHLRRLHAAQGRPQPGGLRRPPALLGGAAGGGAGARRRGRRAVRPRARGRVPGHERAPGARAAGDGRRAAQRHRRGRRRAEHLLVPRRHGGEHLRLPRAVPGGRGGAPRGELPLHRPYPRGEQRGDRRRRAPLRENALDAARGWRGPVARHRARRAGADGLRRGPAARAARGRDAAPRDRRPLPRGLHERGPGDRAHPPRRAVREVGRAQVPRGGAREGRAGVPARAREPARRGELVPAAAPAARGGRRDRARRHRGDRGVWLGGRGAGALHATPEGARVARAPRHAARRADARRPARDTRPRGRDRDDPTRVRRAAARALRQPRGAPGRSGAAADDRRQLPRPRGVPVGAGAGAAERDAGPGRRGDGAGGRLPRAQHRALRQGEGVGRGVPHLGGRRDVADGARGRGSRPAGRGATAHVRRAHAGAARSVRHLSAQLVRVAHVGRLLE
ncbi:MAG: ATP-dependent DNA helicase UvrD/PcrA, proteobacterial paralog, partial [uncultured Gemmatimonadaceae bacterium]